MGRSVLTQKLLLTNVMKLSSKDIILRDGSDSHHFRYLEWDSNFFNRPCYMFDVEKSNITNSDTIADQIQTRLNGAFVTVKINSSYDYNFVQNLQKCGFRYIDTEVTLEFKEKPKALQYKDATEIIKPDYKVDLPYEELGSVYSLTRFHTDPHISCDKADLIWVNYLKNYVIDDYHRMYLALVHGEVAGVVLVNIENEQVMLFYVSVLSSFQNSGVGTKLVQKVVSNYKDSTIRTGTQVKNVPALNFYIRNGFSKIHRTRTVMHRW